MNPFAFIGSLFRSTPATATTWQVQDVTAPAFSRSDDGAGVVAKGSLFPFNISPPADGGMFTGEKVRAPFAQSIWVHSAIKHISGPIAAVPLCLTTDNPRTIKSARRRAMTPPVNDALADYWNNPAYGLDTFAQFIAATVTWRKLAGEAFWIFDDTALVPFPEVRPSFPKIILARPDRMRHVIDAGAIAAWEYTDGTGKRHSLAPDQVIHLKQHNPYDDYRGLGEYEAAHISVATAVGNEKFLKSLADANGDQGVYIVAKNGVPDENQRRQLVDQLREKRLMQQRGIFRPTFLAGDITIEDPKVRSADAQFTLMAGLIAEQIYIAFGVPPSMTKTAASYSIGSASDYYRLILDTCIPESVEIAAGIARACQILTRQTYYASFDWDDHPVMQQVRVERIDTFGKLCDRGMPPRDAGSYLALELTEYPGDDVGMVPIAVTPLSQAVMPPDLSIGNEPGGETEDDNNPGSGAENPDGDVEPVPDGPHGPEDNTDPVQAMLGALRTGVVQKRSAKDQREWQRHMRKRTAVMRQYKSAFTRVLFDARAETLRRLAAHYRPAIKSGKSQNALNASINGFVQPGVSTPHPTTLDENLTGSEGKRIDLGNGTQLTTAVSTPENAKSGAIDYLFNLHEWSRGFQQAIRKVTMATLDSAGQDVYDEAGVDDVFKFPDPQSVQFVSERANKLSGVPDEIFDRIRTSIQDGIDAGDSVKDISDRVREAYNEIGEGRGNTIAQTETAAAFGKARDVAIKAGGIEYKKWLTSGSANVRAAHRAANGQVVASDEPFQVGGETLDYPGDTKGSPANVINCHCVAVPVAAPSEDLT